MGRAKFCSPGQGAQACVQGSALRGTATQGRARGSGQGALPDLQLLPPRSFSSSRLSVALSTAAEAGGGSIRYPVHPISTPEASALSKFRQPGAGGAGSHCARPRCHLAEGSQGSSLRCVLTYCPHPFHKIGRGKPEKGETGSWGERAGR